VRFFPVPRDPPLWPHFNDKKAPAPLGISLIFPRFLLLHLFFPLDADPWNPPPLICGWYRERVLSRYAVEKPVIRELRLQRVFLSRLSTVQRSIARAVLVFASVACFGLSLARRVLLIELLVILRKAPGGGLLSSCPDSPAHSPVRAIESPALPQRYQEFLSFF